MKVHRLLVDAVVQGLMQIFNEKKYADKVIASLLKSNSKWGSRDRAFIAENMYEIVRWWRLLCFLSATSEDALPFQALDIQNIIKTWFQYKGQEIPEWLGKAIPAAIWEERLAQVEANPAIKSSIPDWLYAYGKEELGEKWDTELPFLNQTAPVVLRANTLKNNPLAIQKKLHKTGIETYSHPDLPTALFLEKRQNLFITPTFKEGLFEVQDAASQLVAPYLQVETGLRVIDACAGAGGKSLHLAALMQNKGVLISMDVEEWKLEELRKRAKRAGISNLETRLISSSKVVKRLHESADRLLLDVPCSGMGVLRRNPDAKWKLTPDFLKTVHQTQRQILENYSKMLKKGGKMVYATCSIFPSENTKQVEHFLSQNPTWKWLDERKIFTSETGFDGFYMAILERVS